MTIRQETICYLDDKLAYRIFRKYRPKRIIPRKKILSYCLTDKGYDLPNKIATHATHVNHRYRKERAQIWTQCSERGFGKCTDSPFALSMNGLSFRQAGQIDCVYDKENNEFVDSLIPY